jgi:hypothetical protein
MPFQLAKFALLSGGEHVAELVSDIGGPDVRASLAGEGAPAPRNPEAVSSSTPPGADARPLARSRRL